MSNLIGEAFQQAEQLLKNAFTAAMEKEQLPQGEIPAFTVEIPQKCQEVSPRHGVRVRTMGNP